jgi:phage terminase large subunit GpA-like protein
MLDEIDRFDPIVGEEGSPIGLATVRTRNFPNRKIYAVSTPVLRSSSNIEPLFLAGDRRRYYVPCPHCAHMDFITWSGTDPFEDVPGEHFKITWDEDKPETAAMLCPACGVFIEEGQYKTAMLDAGEWRPTAVCPPEMRSYHLPSMYSPLGWLSWKQMAREHLDAVHESKRGSFSKLQQFVNLSLGEAWEEKGERIKPQTLLDRAEVYAAPVPAGVGVLVASVDVQGDRLEAQVTGYGAGEESWLIHWRRFDGDPDSDALWFELDTYLQRTWKHVSGRELPIERVTIDSGGHHSEKVYRFCKDRLERGVFAVRGGNEAGKPLVGRATTNNKYGTPLFTLCTDTGKERIYARLRITERGPGRYHFPQAHWFDEEYVAQLTAEKKTRKFVKGRGWVPEWKKQRDRNEALDLTVYALAALYILGEDFVERLGAEAERWARPLEGDTETASPENVQQAQAMPTQGQSTGFFVMPRAGSWVTDWRK